MRLMLDANILLDCIVLKSSGLPRPGKAASEQILNLCDQGVHEGLVAWHTLPIVAYYHQRQNSVRETAMMMDAIIGMLEIPSVGHAEAANWRSHGLEDFEDALQLVCAIAGKADVFITRNTEDFAKSMTPVMTPEQFLSNPPPTIPSSP